MWYILFMNVMNVYSWSPDDVSYWHCRSLAFALAPPWGWHVCFLFTFLNSRWIALKFGAHTVYIAPKRWIDSDSLTFHLTSSYGQNVILSSISVFDQIPAKLISIRLSCTFTPNGQITAPWVYHLFESPLFIYCFFKLTLIRQCADMQNKWLNPWPPYYHFFVMLVM